MKFDSQFKFELDPDFESVEIPEPGSVYGVIKIGDFYEHFYMSSSWWSIEDYLRQWDMAFGMLDKGKTRVSFVVNVQPQTPLVETWAAYVEGDHLYIQNYLTAGDTYKELIGDKSFTPETSFDFIPPREIVTEEGDKILEWSVKIIEN